MARQTAIKIFEERRVRTVWDDEKEVWYFSVVDVVSVLTDSIDSRKYWNKLKQRLKEEGNETVTNCHQLKMPAADGKMRLTDVAYTAKNERPGKRPLVFRADEGTRTPTACATRS